MRGVGKLQGRNVPKKIAKHRFTRIFEHFDRSPRFLTVVSQYFCEIYVNILLHSFSWGASPHTNSSFRVFFKKTIHFSRYQKLPVKILDVKRSLHVVSGAIMLLFYEPHRSPCICGICICVPGGGERLFLGDRNFEAIFSPSPKWSVFFCGRRFDPSLGFCLVLGLWWCFHPIPPHRRGMPGG